MAICRPPASEVQSVNGLTDLGQAFAHVAQRKIIAARDVGDLTQRFFIQLAADDFALGIAY